MNACYCCSQKPFNQCCEPFISGKQHAQSAQQLMRSRFTAYTLENYDYVLATYSTKQRASLTTQSLRESASGTQWFALMINQNASLPDNQVEFTAYYWADKHVCILHETSSFVLENNAWYYESGTLHVDCGRIKIGRNDDCPCQSGKKFKQCCQRKLR